MLALPDRPDMLCKRVNTLLLDGRYNDFGSGDYRAEFYTREQFFDVVGEDLTLLRDPKYGLERFLPRTELEWGSDERGVERGFIITERVSGTPLSDFGTMDSTLAAEVDELLAGLLAMGIDHSGPPEQGRQGRLPDIMSFGAFKNIIVGTTASDLVVRPRLVDVHPALAPEISGNFGRWWIAALADLRQDASGYPFEKMAAALDTLFGPVPY